MTTPQSTADLLDGLSRKMRYTYVFFWGDTPRRDGQVDASCLSQWFHAPFTVDGVRYPTAEHWMMAGKARLFGDDAALAAVRGARSAGAAKAAGRAVRNFDEETWRQHRMELVVDGSIHKFSAHPELRDYLLGTGSRVLVEASPVDRVWGIGLAANDEAASVPARWRGSNLLGFALMGARDYLVGQGTSTSTSAS
jgi:ribA/ribD-fused uncharacterized protein